MLREPALSQELQMNVVAATVIEMIRIGSQGSAFLFRARLYVAISYEVLRPPMPCVQALLLRCRLWRRVS